MDKGKVRAGVGALQKLRWPYMRCATGGIDIRAVVWINGERSDRGGQSGAGVPASARSTRMFIKAVRGGVAFGWIPGGDCQLRALATEGECPVVSGQTGSVPARAVVLRAGVVVLAVRG